LHAFLTKELLAMRKTPEQLALTLLSTVMLSGAFTAAHAEDWPRWRGPRNDGTSTETGIAVRWSKTENVKWRLELPGPAPSTPIIWQDRIFLTSAEGADLVLVSANTGGKILWKVSIGSGNYEIRSDESNAASPSPSTDGKFVWVKFGTGLLACYDFKGKEIWQFDLQKRYQPFSMYHGMSSSPLLDGDRLYLQLLHSNQQLVLALDKNTGREIWKHLRKTDAREESMHSYASPFIYRFGQQEFLVAHGSDYVTAHDLKDGRELWRSGGLNPATNYNPYFRFVASPAASPGLIVVPSAKNGPVLGINPQDAKGDITNTPANFHWKLAQNTPDVPSPLIHEGLVYLCRENGVLLCLDAKTGQVFYTERTHNQRHRASPVYADGKIFLTATDGTITAVKPGKQFEIIATNTIEERLSASPAISGGTIYLRSFKALYAIGGK
jgi:outer membrane protein assembly factor BamB